MFEALRVQNFQSHAKFKIDFDKGVTTIVGPSDRGKSAIIRALRWVCQNTPQGTAFIKDDEPGCTVKLDVDGQTIGRKRGRTGDNLYLLGDREFRAFGVGVPDPIAALLNVSDVNFQGQHDSSFWLSLSAGEVSRQLNSVVDLTIIDTSLEEINRRYRAAMQRVDTCRELMTKAKDAKNELAWVADADADLRRVESLFVPTVELAAQRKRLAVATDAVKAASDRLYCANGRLADVNRVGRAAASLRRVSDQRRGLAGPLGRVPGLRTSIDCGVPDIAPLTDAKDALIRLDGQATRLSSLIGRASDYRAIASAGIPEIAGLVAAKKAYDDVTWRLIQLRAMVGGVRSSMKSLVNRKVTLSEAEADLLDKTQGRCPICGSAMG